MSAITTQTLNNLALKQVSDNSTALLLLLLNILPKDLGEIPASLIEILRAHKVTIKTFK